MDLTYKFNSKIWLYPGEAAWHFITLPKEYSEEIKTIGDIPKRGFGSVKVGVTIGESSWRTSIFPDSRSGCYMLPVKKEVRVKNHLVAGDEVEVALSLIVS